MASAGVTLMRFPEFQLVNVGLEECHNMPAMAISDSSDSTTGGAGTFKTTHWSVVLRAAKQSSPGSEEALAGLCQAYWYPLYAFTRRRGHSHHEAEDLTQELFFRLLGKNYLKNIQENGGKFRSYLLTLLKHFLANDVRRLMHTESETRSLRLK